MAVNGHDVDNNSVRYLHKLIFYLVSWGPHISWVSLQQFILCFSLCFLLQRHEFLSCARDTDSHGFPTCILTLYLGLSYFSSIIIKSLTMYISLIWYVYMYDPRVLATKWPYLSKDGDRGSAVSKRRGRETEGQSTLSRASSACWSSQRLKRRTLDMDRASPRQQSRLPGLLCERTFDNRAWTWWIWSNMYI